MKTYVSMTHRLISAGLDPARAVLAVTRAYGLTMIEMEMLWDAIRA